MDLNLSNTSIFWPLSCAQVVYLYLFCLEGSILSPRYGKWHDFQFHQAKKFFKSGILNEGLHGIQIECLEGGPKKEKSSVNETKTQ